MRTLTIYGASDDLIEMEGVPGADEFGAWGNGEGGIRGSFVLGGQMRILAIYGKRGCWSFALGQVDEGIPFPDWPIRIKQNLIRGEVGYSTQVEIDVPDGVGIVREDRSDDD